jgi:hypothetical protein
MEIKKNSEKISLEKIKKEFEEATDSIAEKGAIEEESHESNLVTILGPAMGHSTPRCIVPQK